jgi:hypothetical protein
MTSARASRSARAAVQRSASRRGRPFANEPKGVLTRSTPAACAAHRRPLAAACVRRTVRATHRPCRSAQHTTPWRGDAQLALGATRVGRTHQRRGVRDRAALERDGAIHHAHHAAAVLRTADAAAPIAIGRRTPSADTRPLCAPGPPRTHLCCGAGYRHGVEQRVALGHGEHAATVAINLHTSASRRRSATALAGPSPNRAAHAQQTLHNGLDDRALRDGCTFALCIVQHAPM